jgi:AcrR family transcriptional regulator
VDDIAERTRTTKRMIYYYFGSKEALYSAVLAEAYAEIRAIEQELKLETAEPESAIRRLVEFTFDYHEEHTDFIRLVMIENIHEGRFLKKSQKIGSENSAIITVLRDILERGLKSGAFRRQIDPIDLHMLISSFCFFRSSNRHTFGALFHRDFSQPALRKAHKQLIADAIVGLLKQP